MTPLLGHDDQARVFLDAMASSRLHHAWLLTGPAGIGKAAFARAAAARLLADAAGPPPRATGLAPEPDHPVARLVAERSHPDYRQIERELGDDGEPVRRNIPVDAIRALIPMLGTTPSLSPRRAIVIDPVDDLESSGANALLKGLEEPPAGTVFLLVSHAPGRLLPTIRSRCRVLRFRPLDDTDTRAALRAAMPDADGAAVDALVAVADGSPGVALRRAGLDIPGLDRALSAIAESGDPDYRERLALAKALSPKGQALRYRAFLDRVPAFLADTARRRRGDALARTLTAWEDAKSLAAAAPAVTLDPHGTVLALGGLVAGLAGRQPAAKG